VTRADADDDDAGDTTPTPATTGVQPGAFRPPDPPLGGMLL